MCPWYFPLKGKQGTTIMQNILDESNRKANKIWFDKGSEFYDKSMKPRLEKNSTEIYSMHNEVKPFPDERFIRTLKNKIYKYITSIQKIGTLINKMIQSINITTPIMAQLKWNM